MDLAQHSEPYALHYPALTLLYARRLAFHRFASSSSRGGSDFACFSLDAACARRPDLIGLLHHAWPRLNTVSLEERFSQHSP